MGRIWVILAPCALLLLLLSDKAAQMVLHHEHENRFAPESPHSQGSGFLPALRGLLVQIWMIRIDADLRAGRPHKALRLGREMLRMAPGLPRTRTRLADILAYRVAPMEAEPERQVAWIAEGLAVLDEGLARDPTCSEFHTDRGLLIWSRGSVSPEFAAAFFSTYGTTTMEAGVAALVRGAELARGRWWALRAAGVVLQLRGDAYLERADAGARDLLHLALDDYQRESGYLRELLQFSDYARGALELDLALAEVCRQQVICLIGREQGRSPETGPLLAAVKKAWGVFRTGQELPVGRVRLATVLLDLLVPLESDPAQRDALRAAAVQILAEGLAREPGK